MGSFGNLHYLAVLFTLLTLVTATGAGAGLVEVPADAATINAGIALAAPGDTVLVAPGTYRENIDFGGKNIVLASRHLVTGNIADILATVIDGSEPGHPDTTSAVLFHNGEDHSAVLHGFTITGGTGTVWIDPAWPDWIWRGGGGVFIFQASPTIRHNLITHNRSTDEGAVHGAQGGGILAFQGDPIVAGNSICSNESSYGGGLAIDYAGGTYTNNLFRDNLGGYVWGGGAIWTIGSWTAPIFVDNNTIVDNHSPTYAGAIYVWGSLVTARNNIIWGNSQTEGGSIELVYGGQIDITYSDIEGSYPGEGNIDANPGFADLDALYLDPTSPCVDAGHRDGSFDDPEDPAEPGQALWPALGTTHNDMGCYGGPGSGPLACDDVTAVGDEGAWDPASPADVCFALAPCFPNPLTCETMISFRIPHSADVDLAVYDLRGRLVADLVHMQREAGTHRVTWDGRDRAGEQAATGLYLVRLRSEGRERAAKVMLVR